MLRNKTASTHKFSVIPESHIPRSRFAMPQTRKMAFNASELIPIMCEPVLPGDVWEHRESIAARLPTLIAPIIDDLDLETFYFFVPNRLTDEEWEDLITGEDDSLTVATVQPTNAPPSSVTVGPGGLFDHLGLIPQTYSVEFRINRFPVSAYFEIWNKWFRDENLQEPWAWPTTDRAIDSAEYTQDGVQWAQQCLRANKRHDIFTAALPWPQKGAAVTMPLGSTAPIIGLGVQGAATAGPVAANQTFGSSAVYANYYSGANPLIQADPTNNAYHNVYADLSAATAATLNSLRLASVTQQLLELDARGGSRYVENLLAHWGVRSPDFRLQNPEYLGGSKIPITVNPVAQTAAYDADGGTIESALGNLGAEAHASSSRGTFRYAATEHGYIMGLAVLRATPTYQQGTRYHWRQQTRYDFPDPILMNIGEVAIPTQEIYQPTNNAPTNATWGYQEAWAQFRIIPNEITGNLRSTASAPMDWWHLSEEFGTEPALNASFITDKTQEVLARSLATAPNEQWSAQCVMDITHHNTVARLMPAYSVPGLRRF